jgi:hypothetical protein
VKHQQAMSAHARRNGLEALRAVLRRHNPGFDAVFEIERGDRAGDTAAREVGGCLASPEDASAVGDRVDIAAPPTRPAHDHAVDEPGEDFAPIVGGEG